MVTMKPLYQEYGSINIDGWFCAVIGMQLMLDRASGQVRWFDYPKEACGLTDCEGFTCPMIMMGEDIYEP